MIVFTSLIRIRSDLAFKTTESVREKIILKCHGIQTFVMACLECVNAKKKLHLKTTLPTHGQDSDGECNVHGVLFL